MDVPVRSLRPSTHDQHRAPRSDADIAQDAKLLPILQLARDWLGIGPEHLQPYGHTKAKLSLDFIASLRDQPDGKLVLVTAITPTPAGEGKTTTTVGLSDGLNHIGRRAIACLREPSLGPCFGMKGAAAGGGYAQVVPMADINLHFTGDFHAITAANNLLAALVDNHVYWGNALDLDPRRITWRRALDMNDRALRVPLSVRWAGSATATRARTGSTSPWPAKSWPSSACRATSTTCSNGLRASLWATRAAGGRCWPGT